MEQNISRSIDPGDTQINNVNSSPIPLHGRRIISITDFFEQVKELNSHSPIDCNFSHMKFLRERRIGLISGFTFKCSMCDFESTIWSEKIKQDLMDVNTSAVSGTMTTGGGHCQLEELLSTMDIPSISDKTFKRKEDDLSRSMMATAEWEMMEATPATNFLGATPDGVIGKEGILEIKCPSSAKNMTPDEAILNRKVTFWTKNKDGSIGGFNQNHPYFYQIQGQLQVTRRDYCIFALWTPKGIKTERFNRDKHFWEQKMREKLEKFYLNCILPEIIDPRHNRSMPIRNPHYILEAREKKNAPYKS